jgi:AraC-like DNA-binding protein
MNFLSRFRMPSFDSMAKELKRRIEEFDINPIEEKLTQLGFEIEKNFTNLKKKIKNLTDRFIIEVPFDRETQKLFFNIENNVMEVKTETQTETTHSVSTTTTTIPESVNTDTLIQKYDSENKKMKFIFFKWNKLDFDEEEEALETDESIESTETVEEPATTTEVPTFEEANVTATSTLDVDNTAVHTHASTVMNTEDYLLETILALRAQGMSYRAIAAQVGVSDKTVARWIKKATETQN